jgi:antitoxin YefM
MMTRLSDGRASYSTGRNKFGKNYRESLQRSCTRNNHRKRECAVVMMSVEDYQAFEETAHLLCSPKTGRRLLESAMELKSTGDSERELIE